MPYYDRRRNAIREYYMYDLLTSRVSCCVELTSCRITCKVWSVFLRLVGASFTNLHNQAVVSSFTTGITSWIHRLTSITSWCKISYCQPALYRQCMWCRWRVVLQERYRLLFIPPVLTFRTLYFVCGVYLWFNWFSK